MKRYANYYKMFVNGEYNGTIKAQTKKDALEMASNTYEEMRNEYIQCGISTDIEDKFYKLPADKSKITVEKINKIHNKYLVMLVHPETEAQIGIYVDHETGYFTAEVFKKFSDRDKEVVMARDFDDDLDYFVEKVLENDILSDYLIEKYGQIHESKPIVSKVSVETAKLYAKLVAQYSKQR